MLLVVLVAAMPLVSAHGAMVTPRSRNSIDWQEGPLRQKGVLGGTTWYAVCPKRALRLANLHRAAAGLGART